MKDRRLLEAGEDFAIIGYRAEVARADCAYAALVSSAYRRRPDGWKLAFHQHSPTSRRLFGFLDRNDIASLIGRCVRRLDHPVVLGEHALDLLALVE